MIHDRIYSAIINAKTQGKDPSNLYLGVKESIELEALFSCNTFYSECRTKTKRSEIYGLKVFLVDSESHLKVS